MVIICCLHFIVQGTNDNGVLWILFIFVLESDAAAATPSSPFATLQTPPTDKTWSFLFDTDSYSYQEYGSLFTLRVFNMPVSEGNTFNLNFTLSDLSINHAVVTPSSETAVDRIEIDVITGYWVEGRPERDVVTIQVPLDGLVQVQSVPISFPERRTPYVATSSHQFIFKVPTHRIGPKAGLDLTLTKADNTLRFLPNKPFVIPGYNNTLVDQFKFKIFDSKSPHKKEDKEIQRGFEIELNSISIPVELGTTPIHITNNSTGLWTMTPHKDASAECTFAVDKASYKAAVNQVSPGVWALTPEVTAPLVPKGKSITVRCPQWDIRVTKDLIAKRLTWTVSAEIATTTTTPIQQRDIEKMMSKRFMVVKKGTFNHSWYYLTSL